MRKYTHLFFDLDRTLWDFDSNIAQTLIEVIDVFNLQDIVADKQNWVECYKKHDAYVWDLLSERKINKTNLRVERFRLLLLDFDVDDLNLAKQISEFYVVNSPSKSLLMPDTISVLAYLKQKYKLQVVSNGFYETQTRKMLSGGIDAYFEKVFTSDMINVAKPDRRIFEYALKSCNAKKDKSLFIGDNLKNDVLGPKKFGMDQVWYNHDKFQSDNLPTYSISSLIELKDFL